MPSIARKRPLRKKFKQHFLSVLQKSQSTQTSGSAFAERNEKAKRNNFEVELINFVEYFLDVHSKYDNNLEFFNIKSL